MKRFAVLVIVVVLWPMVASAQGAPLQYGQRIPSRIPGWYAPVASNLIGSDEKDHLGRGSVNAWDWSTALGSPVFAIGPGMVNYAGCNDAGHYGCWVRIDHGSGYESSSAHCAENSIRVRYGQQVDASTHICNIGRTGWTSWPHVHLVIKKDGVHQKISNFFDVRLVHYCFWTRCRASNDPNAPVANGTIQPGQQPTVTGQPSATTGETFQMRVAGGLRLLNEQQRAMLLWVMILIPMWLVWVSGGVVRTVVVSSLTSLTIMAAVLWWLNPVIGQPVMAAQAVGPVGNWRQAYQIVQGSEGWSCTNDGAYTMGGVTQGAYNRWRAKHGMGSADVCANLTREQAQQVFYEMYWLPVGADKMPWALGLTVVDHYYNTGKVSHLLAKCGQDVKCFNNARVIDYRKMKACKKYCAGWINRVTKIRKYTEVN